MEDHITIQTDLFEHREVKPHFINPCCFGEDFANWVRQRLREAGGIKTSEPIQEDYGWGVWASASGLRFWIALSYVGDGPQEDPPEWVVSVSGPGVFAKLFKKPIALKSFTLIRDCIWDALANQEAIEVVE